MLPSSAPSASHVRSMRDEWDKSAPPPTKWPSYILDAHARRRQSLGAQMRDLSILSLCTGLCAESTACRALNIKVSVEAACDIKKNVEIVQACKTGPERPKHFFGDVFGLVSGDSTSCQWHATTSQCQERLQNLDLLVAGFPCQPYTKQNPKRRKVGSGASTEEHRLQRVTAAMHDALERFTPKGFIFEQVPGFADVLPEHGKSALELFIEKVKAQGKYHVFTFALHLEVWVEASRTRRRGDFGVTCGVQSRLFSVVLNDLSEKGGVDTPGPRRP